jgi:hypothetical protein
MTTLGCPVARLPWLNVLTADLRSVLIASQNAAENRFVVSVTTTTSRIPACESLPKLNDAHSQAAVLGS